MTWTYPGRNAISCLIPLGNEEYREFITSKQLALSLKNRTHYSPFQKAMHMQEEKRKATTKGQKKYYEASMQPIYCIVHV